MGKVKVIYSFRAILFVHVVLSLLVHSFAHGEKNPCLSDKHASKQVAKHFKFPSHFQQHMAVCGLFLRLGISGSHKTLEQNFIFQIGTLYPHGIKFILIYSNFSRKHVQTNTMAQFSANKQLHNLQFLHLLQRRASARNVSFETLQIHVINSVDNT